MKAMDGSKSSDAPSTSSQHRRKRADSALPVPPTLGRIWAALTRPILQDVAPTFDESDLPPRSEEETSDSMEPETVLVGPDGQTGPIASVALARAVGALRNARVLQDFSSFGDISFALDESGLSIERSVQLLTQQRAEAAKQVAIIRALRERLTIIHEDLQQISNETGGRSQLMPEGVEARGEEVAASRLPAEFLSETPLSLTVTGVTDFNLIIRLYGYIMGVRGVTTAVIESFQDNAVHFVVTLDDVVTDTALHDGLSWGFGDSIQLIDFDVAAAHLHFNLAGNP